MRFMKAGVVFGILIGVGWGYGFYVVLRLAGVEFRSSSDIIRDLPLVVLALFGLGACWVSLWRRRKT